MPAPVAATTATLPGGRSGEDASHRKLRGGDRACHSVGCLRPTHISTGGAPVS